MGIPQILVVVLACFNLGMAMASHGKPQQPVNFWIYLASTATTIALLWWGGFWTGGC